MTHLKVCGVTTAGSLAAAVEGGADFVGLNLWPRSSRYLPVEAAAALAAEAPPGLTRVGLFVNASEDAVHGALEMCSLDLLQFHGDETPEFCRRFGVPFMKAFRLRDEASVDAIGDYLDGPDSHFLVDAFVPGRVGGTGAPVSLDLARRARERWEGRMLLAGGLRAETVAEAIRAVRPWGVDVASGVESAPGIKDPAAVRAFAAAVREAA